MAERVISVKMPVTLLQALRNSQEKNHYIDLSEQLRSIVRMRCLELSNPYTEELKRLRSDLEQQAQLQTGQLAREQILKEMIELLKGGAK